MRTAPLFALMAFVLGAVPTSLRADDEPHLGYLLGTHLGRGTLETTVRPPFRKATTSTIHVTATMTFHRYIAHASGGPVKAVAGTLKIHGAGRNGDITLVINPDYAWVAHDRGHLEVEVRAPLLRDGRMSNGNWIGQLPIRRDDAGRTLHIDAENLRRAPVGSKLVDLRRFLFNIAPGGTHVRIVITEDAADPLYDSNLTQALSLEFDF